MLLYIHHTSREADPRILGAVQKNRLIRKVEVESDFLNPFAWDQ